MANRFLDRTPPSPESSSPTSPEEKPNRFLDKRKELPPEGDKESWGKYLARKALQIPLGFLQKYTYPADLAQAAGAGFAQSEINQFLASPEDREAYTKGVESAAQFIPTQHQYESAIEKETGWPLTPQDTLDKILRLGSSAGAFAPAGAANRLGAATATPAASQALQFAGVPESIADPIALGGVGAAQHGIKALSESAAKTEAKLLGAAELPRSTFETAEKIAGEAKGFADIQPLKEGKPFGVDIQVQPPAGPYKDLAGRATRLGEAPSSAVNEVGNVITKDRFPSRAEAGSKLSTKIKENAKADREPVTAAYAEAEKITAGHADVYPELAHEIEAIIADLEKVAKRNPGQEAVYKEAKAIQELVGTTEGLVEANAERLVRQADASSQLANYDLPYSNYKSVIKKIVKETNNAVEESLLRAGKLDEAIAVREADILYSKWADKYLGDEVSPFLEKKILNPESLYEGSVNNPGVYRAVKTAVGESEAMIGQLDREVAEAHMSKYVKKPRDINSPEYIRDLNDLEQLVGKKRADAVNAHMQKVSGRQKVHEREMAKQKTVTTRLEETGKKVANPQKESQRLSGTAKKIAENAKKYDKLASLTPEDVQGMLNTRSGIRQLKKISSEKNFDTITKQKARSIMREGNIEANFKGDDLAKVLNKESNFEILSEIFGEEAVEATRQEAIRSGKRQMRVDTITDLAKKKAILRFLGFVAPFI